MSGERISGRFSGLALTSRERRDSWKGERRSQVCRIPGHGKLYTNVVGCGSERK